LGCSGIDACQALEAGVFMVRFDIDTKVTRPDQTIWAVFPGLARRFFDLFQNNDLVFLDTPDLHLNTEAIANDYLLKQHVAMSLAWKNYHLGGSEKIPSRNPGDYISPKDRSFRAYPVDAHTH
jgi:hypothetical protein